jgi:hypothetical protein
MQAVDENIYFIRESRKLKQRAAMRQKDAGAPYREKIAAY